MGCTCHGMVSTRALPLRSRSALVLGHEIQATVAQQTRDAVPLVRAALIEMREAMSLDELEQLVRREQERLAKADMEEIGEAAAVGRVVHRIARRALSAGMRLESRHVPPAMAPPGRAIGERLTVTERAARWAETRSSALVVGIKEGTRAALRASVAASIRAGLHVGPTTKLLREIVPLDERRAKALTSYRLRLEADGVLEERAERMVARYAERLLTQRAETIARTESFAALSEGRLDLWRELIGEGHVSREAIVRQWLTGRDERVCDECGALDGQTAGFEEGFEMPPLHVSCRCVVTLEVTP